jgi:hypothetical protein
MQIVTGNSTWGGGGGEVTAAIKPPLHPPPAVVTVPFICPDKQNPVNYRRVNSFLFYSSNDIGIMMQYCVLFDFRVIMRCISYFYRGKRTEGRGFCDVCCIVSVILHRTVTSCA